MTLIKVILASFPEAAAFILPYLLYSVNVMGLGEAFVVSGSFALYLLYSCDRDVKLDFLNSATDRNCTLVIAPEESASNYARRFMTRMFELKPHTEHGFCYAAVGTSTLKEVPGVNLVYDISHEVMWGLPRLSQLVSLLLIYFKIAEYIVKNKDKMHSVIFYSNPDLIYQLLPYLKKYAPEIKYIVVGLPEKDVVLGNIGEQTKMIIEDSDKVILNMYGGRYSDFYDLLKKKNMWDNSKMAHCQSSYIMSYINQAMESSFKKESKDVVVMLGSRIPEINKHAKIAHKLFDSELGENVVLMAPNESVKDILEDKFPKSKVVLEDDYDYLDARLMLCKSGSGLIKPILFGIPTIPYYLPNFRTLCYLNIFSVVARFKGKQLDKKDFILPYLVTNKEFLRSDFFGSFSIEKLVSTAVDSYNNPPDMEEFRVEFAKNYLGSKLSTSSFKELVNEYLITSGRLLIDNLHKINDTFNLSDKMQKKLQYVLSYLEAVQDGRRVSRRELEYEAWSIIAEIHAKYGKEGDSKFSFEEMFRSCMVSDVDMLGYENSKNNLAA